MDTGYSAHVRHWALDTSITFLNHGSFGACPRALLAHQAELRARLEAEPVTFLVRELEGRLAAARAALAGFAGGDPDGYAFVPNATSGINTVLRSLRFGPGDELVVTDQEYNASRNALEHVAGRAGARVVVVEIPFPIASPAEVVERVVGAVGPRTRLVLVDHITSPTGLIYPIAEIVREVQSRGADALVDGAHAPGMVDLDLAALGAAYYTGNCHKWICAPKGAAFLHVREDRRDGIVPLAISHGWNDPRTGLSRYRRLFDWGGTDDPTPWLSIPEAIRFLGGLLPGGWPALRAHNRALALDARAVLCKSLDIEPPAPESMIGSLAAVPIPDGESSGPGGPFALDALNRALFERHRIEVPVFAWPRSPRRLLRISAQLYNARPQFERLAAALGEELAAAAGQ